MGMPTNGIDITDDDRDDIALAIATLIDSRDRLCLVIETIKSFRDVDAEEMADFNQLVASRDKSIKTLRRLLKRIEESS